MHSHRLPGAVLAALALVALLQSGCSRSLAPVAETSVSDRDAGTAALQSPGGRSVDASFYPLEVGNRWGYRRTIRFATVPTNGTEGETMEFRERWAHELACGLTFAGRDYVAETHIPIEVSSTPGPRWVVFRQDASGLYEAENAGIPFPPCITPAAGAVPASARGASGALRPATPDQRIAQISDPTLREATRLAWQRAAARAMRVREAIGLARGAGVAARSGGVQPGEITRLRYPLRLGQRWLIRDQPDLVLPAEVEAHDALDLPIGRTPAWRVHIQWPNSDEDFRVVAWYGRAGYLGLQVHSVSPLVDATGNVIGTFVYDEDEHCDEITLVE